MSFAKSPRQIRSGVNTIPTPRRSISGSEEAEVRVAVETPVASTKKAGRHDDHLEPPFWLCVGTSFSAVINLTAILVILHGWIEVRDLVMKDGSAPPMWFFGSVAASKPISGFGYALFLVGVVGAMIFSLSILIRYQGMRAYGVWSFLFISLMLFNFNFFLYLLLNATFDESRAKTSLFVFNILGGLVSGSAAAAGPRTRVWRSPGFTSNGPKWAMKICLAVGIIGFGLSPLVSIAVKNGKAGFYLGLVSFTIVKGVTLSTMVMNLLARRRQAIETDDRAPLIDTATRREDN